MAQLTKKTVELFYDVVSPYSWLAFEVLCRYRSNWNLDLQLKPFFLSGVMEASGNRPPGLVPNKFKYMYKDLSRLAEYYKVPLQPPKNVAEVMFEKGSLKAQRFITAVDMMNIDKTEEISRQLWMKIWSKDEDITLPESFVDASNEAGLEDAEITEALSMMSTLPVKNRLRAYTDRAVKLEAFGAPYIVAHVEDKEEVIFGADRFPILAALIDEHWMGPVPAKSKL
ncbi:hypothetical protein LOTGIDRAFT_108316 [Lottia gigantea]|uniref:Glutathione S-transferase kappa n=1 Tax=Lottia gigantea TaxID=225164 RepID=V3Z0Q7_LOTGI|nr:hypothetical protein LOTGIDRAFT_108316 [Lottia gigantea]ESO84078.1 hypothetical protein LOTGIDRAFT_108316 [Lottia gigantea]